ncbi:uncharacterized protein LOC135140798 [Zophobas morio]|uniref:uncharacterized protein LOC135140798 n=1 Tax=Zophobas morio TaxID=2755281 RepID=UPI0030838B12
MLKIQVGIFLISSIFLLFLVFLRFRYEKITFGLISDTFESTFTLVHVLPKFVTLALARHRIKKLLETTRKFWFFKQFQETNNELKILTFVLQSFLFFVCLVILIFAIRPIFNDALAINCHVPRFFPTSVFTVFNNLVFSFSAFAVGSFDMFVCVMVVLVALQLKILSRVILGVNLAEDEMCLKKLKMCINYHNFLNDFLQEVNSIVSPALLVYFTLAPVALCFELFFISKSPNLAETAKSCIYVSGIVIELFFFFCLPATHLMIESEQMVNVVYNTHWENSCSLPVRRTLIIMMQRMQKENILSAGKMAFRMAVSFYTCLQIVDERTGKKCC